ncbi:MAG: SDR family NAD(P)-dependent oxidoreductase [Cyanosarcina radialis HA8281-LM2]|jgi:acyl transferase domain-containing protein/acyl carrier protein|nr:SDR family NAD(P)-dependent oxidoreductase [Cyanosarcina radialis HA8281-LM2]
MTSSEISNSIEGIAIIGMAGRFPGAKNIDEFWENLRDGIESISWFTDEELLAAGINSNALIDENYIKAGANLENIDLFDADFFGFNPQEASRIDPQHRIFLECAWEALEDAGYDSQTYKDKIGVYAGVGWNGYLLFNVAPDRQFLESAIGYQTLLGNDKDFLTTRVSYQLNLKGPSIDVQTACSTSLVAVSMACQSLLAYQCDLALAGGITVSAIPKTGYLYQEGGILSPDGHCRAFDAEAKGTVPGHGAGIVVLKRLEEAIADGDCIHAVIRGAAINNDGAMKVGYTAPSVDGQAEVIAEALALAGIEPETISYIEAHGTGTPLGDPIEIAALTQVFGASTDKQGFCALGSVKTNIGHLDAAAGVAGLIKTVLALKHQLIPPSLHFQQPNPKIDFSHSPFYVNHQLQEWKSNGHPRRAGVSSFGIGGTNAHVVLEEALLGERERGREGERERKYQLLVLSAKTSSALGGATENLVAYLQKHSDRNLADVAYTLQVGRRSFPHRRMVVCRDLEDAIEVLKSQDSQSFTEDGKTPLLAFMFPGQGTQYVGMGKELYRTEPVFQEQIDRCCQLLEPHLGLDLRSLIYPDGDDRKSSSIESPNTALTPPAASLSQAWERGRGEGKRGTEAAEKLKPTAIAQPALFVIEYALAQLWMSWGISPQAAIGHSIGEYVAATLAGVFSLEDALTLVAARGRLMQQIPSGAMLSVALSEEEVRGWLKNPESSPHPALSGTPLPSLGEGKGVRANSTLSIAAINAPNSCVVSGTEEAIALFQEELSSQGISCRRLHTSHAFHSPMMDGILAAFREEVKKIKLHSPSIPFISNLTGTWITAAQATDPNYWAQHLRQTVRFSAGISQLLEDPNRILLEVGPGNTLCTLASKQSSGVALASLRHPQQQQSDVAFLLNTLGKLWLSGVKIDWSGFYAHQRRYRLPLPTYPFERQRYWIEQKATDNGRGAMLCAPTEGGITQEKSDIADWFYVPSWKLAPLSPLASPTSLAPYLVFVDECGLGERLLERLKLRGEEAIAVRVGTQFAKLSRDSYTIDPLEADDYKALVNTLIAQQLQPKAIAHLWNVTPAESSSPLATHHSLLFLAQALGKLTDELQIAVISNNLQEVTGEELLDAQKATLLGLVTVIPQEYPNIKCRSIDLVLPQTGSRGEEKAIDRLLQELQATSPRSASSGQRPTPRNLTPSPSPTRRGELGEGAGFDSVIAYRGNHRWVQHFEPVRLDTVASPTPKLRERGVYLITGGLGGIGLVLAKHLAQQVRAKLVLIGRSWFPKREEWQQWLANNNDRDAIARKIRYIQEIESLGAEVLVISTDVSNIEQMQQAIIQAQNHFGQFNGVIHAAGVPGGGAIQRKTAEMAESILDPKVRGTLVLKRIFQDVPLDFLVLCSSLTAIEGGFGQADYASANAFLDAFARQETNSNGRFTVSINWDTWQEVGMAVEALEDAASTEQIVGWVERSETQHPENRVEGKSIRHRFIQQGLSPQEGVTVFSRILGSGLSQVLVSKRDLSDLSQQNMTLSLPTEITPKPQSQHGDIPPQNEIESTIGAIWQEMLGRERVSIRDNFFDLGGDSLLLVQVRSKLHAALNCEISTADLFEYPTIATLAAYLSQKQAGETSFDPIRERAKRQQEAEMELMQQSRRGV